MRVTLEHHEGIDVLALEGDVDLSNVSEFVQALLDLSASGDARILLDLERASFIDSTVVNALFASIARIRRAGGELTIVCPNPLTRRVLEIAGLDAIFHVVDSRGEGLAALTEAEGAPGR